LEVGGWRLEVRGCPPKADPPLAGRLEVRKFKMRKAYKFKKRQRDEKSFRFNEQIRAPELMVIDENGNSLGVLSTSKALAIANERGYDLIEVAPLANPPVAKFLDFGSFQYQREKQFKKQRLQSKALDVKSIRLSTKINEHDRETKINQADKFLIKGHKIKVELILKGREIQHLDLAKEALMNFRKGLTQPTQIEQDTTKQGNKIFLILLPDRSVGHPEQKANDGAEGGAKD
jgi:translation initiation factor IF-3